MPPASAPLTINNKWAASGDAGSGTPQHTGAGPCEGSTLSRASAWFTLQSTKACTRRDACVAGCRRVYPLAMHQSSTHSVGTCDLACAVACVPRHPPVSGAQLSDGATSAITPLAILVATGVCPQAPILGT